MAARDDRGEQVRGFARRLTEERGIGKFYADTLTEERMRSTFEGITATLRSTYRLFYYPTDRASPGELRGVEVTVVKPNGKRDKRHEIVGPKFIRF